MDQLLALPFNTEDYGKILESALGRQRERINERMALAVKERMLEASTFAELQAIREEIGNGKLEAPFSGEQELVLTDVFEYHMSRLRDRYLDGITQKIASFTSGGELAGYWDAIKYELRGYRPFVGKEYESLMAEFIEQKLKTIEAP
jgi:hypothetical protein